MSRRLYGSIEVTDYTVDAVAYPATAVDIIKFREQFSASYTGSAELVRIEVGNAVPTWWMDLVFDDTTRFTVTTNVDWATLVTTAATWGISLEATQPTGWAYIPVTFNYGVTNEATAINPLYGGVKDLTSITCTFNHLDNSPEYHVIGTVDYAKFISKYNSWAHENNVTADISGFRASYSKASSSTVGYTYYARVGAGSMAENVFEGTSKTDFIQALADWGITPGGSWYSDTSAFRVNYSDMDVTDSTYAEEANRISKLYGSVNGVTKLVYQDFGHADYSGIWGTVYYRESSTSEEESIKLQSQAEFESLCVNGAAATITIGDITFYKAYNLGSPVITGIDIGTAITNVPDYFGDHMSWLEHITIPEGVTTIGDDFMDSTFWFNSNVQLPSTLTSIGKDFFRSQYDMVSEINVGNLPTSILPSGSVTKSYIFSASSTRPAYTTGIKIAGANRAAWLSALPNSSSSPYRKLVDAGH